MIMTCGIFRNVWALLVDILIVRACGGACRATGTMDELITGAASRTNMRWETKSITRSPCTCAKAQSSIPLDTWLAQAFTPCRIEQSLTALEDAQPDDGPVIEAAQRAIAECDRKLARHRAALEAGADPALVVAWSTQVQQQRAVAEARLATLTSRHGTNRRMSRNDIGAMVDTLGGLLDVLRHADPADKAEVYRELGVRLTYNHTERTVLAETRPTSSVCVVFVSEGGLDHYAH